MQNLPITKCTLHEIEIDGFQGEFHYVSKKGNLHIIVSKNNKLQIDGGNGDE